MINAYILKKYIALTMLGLFPMMCFTLFFQYSSKVQNTAFIYACIATAILFLILFLLTNWMLNHPLRQLIEGQGHLIITDDSTGSQRCFIFKRITPLMDATIDGQEVNQAFDRKLIQYLTAPIECKEDAKVNKDGDLTFTIKREEYNNAVRSFENYRVIYFNTILKTVVTKDFLKEKEDKAFSEYQIFNLYIHLKGMEGYLRNLFRYVGDQFMPKEGLSLGELMKKWWFWAIVIVFLGVLVYLLWPSISKAVANAAPAVSNIAGNANGVIKPK